MPLATSHPLPAPSAFARSALTVALALLAAAIIVSGPPAGLFL